MMLGERGCRPPTYAVTVADSWKKGLADWGISPDRIAQLKNSVEYTIFTPGIGGRCAGKHTQQLSLTESGLQH